MGLEVVGDGGDEVGAGDGAVGERDGPDAEDAVDALEPICSGGDADGLLADGEGGGEGDGVGV